MFDIDRFLNSPKVWGGNNLTIGQLRNLSRKINKDNVFIAGFTKNFLSLILSQGVHCSFTTFDNRSAKEFYYDFAKAPSVRGDEDINEFLRRLLFAVITDGDVLVYSTSRKDYSDYDIDENEELVYKEKLKIGTVPANLVMSPSPDSKIFHTKTNEEILNLDKFSIVDGCVLERDQIIGYTVIDTTGKDIFWYYPRTFGKYFSATLMKSPIPTGDPSSIRGIPLLSPALKALDDVTKLLDAEVKSQTVKTKMPMKLEITDPDASADQIKKIKDDTSVALSETSTNEANVWFSTAGTKLEAFDHKNNAQTQIDYLITPMLRYISGLYGVSYDALTKDLSNASGATARALYAQAYADTEIWRKQLYSQILDPMMYLLLDRIGIDPKISEWQYSVKQFGYLKSKEEYDANKLAVDSKQKTYYENVTQQGYDPEEMLKQDAYILELQRQSNPLAGINMTEFLLVMEKYNSNVITDEQYKLILESWQLDSSKYIISKPGAMVNG